MSEKRPVNKAYRPHNLPIDVCWVSRSARDTINTVKEKTPLSVIHTDAFMLLCSLFMVAFTMVYKYIMRFTVVLLIVGYCGFCSLYYMHH